MSAPAHLKANDYGAGDAQLYETLPEMVVALLRADRWFDQPRLILEPACGPGAITQVLQDFGHTVISSDLNQYELRWKGRPAAGAETPTWFFDFFNYAPGTVRDIVPDLSSFAILTNPPYNSGSPGDDSLAARFAAHARELSPRVYMLLELGFQQGGQGCPYRDELIDTDEFSGLFAFRERCPMQRDGYPIQGSQMRQHAWYRWTRERQPFRYQRLSWKQAGPCPRGRR